MSAETYCVSVQGEISTYLTQVPETMVSYRCEPEASKARDQRRREKERAERTSLGRFLPVVPRSQPLTVGGPEYAALEGALPITLYQETPDGINAMALGKDVLYGFDGQYGKTHDNDPVFYDPSTSVAGYANNIGSMFMVKVDGLETIQEQLLGLKF